MSELNLVDFHENSEEEKVTIESASSGCGKDCSGDLSHLGESFTGGCTCASIFSTFGLSWG